MSRARLWVVGGVVALLTLSGTTTAVAEEPAQTAGPERVAAPGVAPAEIPVPLPDLGLAHRAADGGINLFRAPLSELEDGYGEVELVRNLPARAGWRFDGARVLAGDFADFTVGDDGTADHLIWHALPDGGVRLWAVAGGADTAPRVLRTLRPPWSWAGSRPMVGDVNGDGWDDLVVHHEAPGNDRWWLFQSDGQRLGAPSTLPVTSDGFRWSRHVLGALDVYDGDELLEVNVLGGSAPALFYTTSSGLQSGGGGGIAFEGLASRGWVFDTTRTLLGEVTGDALDDIVTVRRATDGGMTVWRHDNCEGSDATSFPDCFEAPVRSQVLPAASGWSFASSRQYLADTNGDEVLDLISVQRTGTGGIIVWRHPSNGATLAAPQAVLRLPRANGWQWSYSRESVADTWGVLVV